MKKLFSYVGLAAFMLSSFYFTEKIALMAREKDPMLEQIKAYDKENTDYVNATISGNTIIPGINGQELDEIKSLMNMKKAGSFSESFLVYKSIAPLVSLKDNLDKIIIRGNQNKKGVALILEDNDTLIKYLEGRNIPFSVLTTLDNYKEDKKYELINYEEEDNYKKLDRLLDKNNINTNICLVDSYCPNYKYKVKTTYTLSKNNLITVKNALSSGDIIRVSKNTRIEDVDILMQQIQSRKLNIMLLSKLISEEN